MFFDVSMPNAASSSLKVENWYYDEMYAAKDKFPVKIGRLSYKTSREICTKIYFVKSFKTKLFLSKYKILQGETLSCKII